MHECTQFQRNTLSHISMGTKLKVLLIFDDLIVKYFKVSNQNLHKLWSRLEVWQIVTMEYLPYIYIYIYRYIHGHTYMDILDMMHGRTTTFKSLLIRDLHSILYLHMYLKILINNTLKA
jgi:hypothetical protein